MPPDCSYALKVEEVIPLVWIPFGHPQVEYPSGQARHVHGQRAVGIFAASWRAVRVYDLTPQVERACRFVEEIGGSSGPSNAGGAHYYETLIGVLQGARVEVAPVEPEEGRDCQDSKQQQDRTVPRPERLSGEIIVYRQRCIVSFVVEGKVRYRIRVWRVSLLHGRKRQVAQMGY